MIYLGAGVLMLAAAVILFRLALPQTGVAPMTTFLARTRLHGAFAVFLTALFGAGCVSSAFGVIHFF